MKKIILIGAPGSGKGTQAKIISDTFNLPHISSGDLLREEKKKDTDRAKIIADLIDNGSFVPDELILSMIQDRIQQSDCINGFILDGFPRNIEQAKKMFALNIIPDYVIEIDVPFDLILTRITGRLTHLSSGRSYHTIYNPPKTPNIDDVTGEHLIQRDDDKAEYVQHRLNQYVEKTKPVVDFYEKQTHVDFISVDGTLNLNDVSNNIIEFLNK